MVVQYHVVYMLVFMGMTTAYR